LVSAATAHWLAIVTQKSRKAIELPASCGTANQATPAAAARARPNISVVEKAERAMTVNQGML
jgi:hypothetical protein